MSRTVSLGAAPCQGKRSLDLWRSAVVAIHGAKLPVFGVTSAAESYRRPPCRVRLRHVPMKEPELIRSGQAARLLGVQRQRLDQLSREKGFPEPYLSIDGQRFWKSDDILTWKALYKDTKEKPPQCPTCRQPAFAIIEGRAVLDGEAAPARKRAPAKKRAR